MPDRPLELLACVGLALAVSASAVQLAPACTRAVYLGDGIVITGRNSDWDEDLRSNLWIFPRGMKRDGAAGPDSAQWVSKYGSVAASAYEFTTADGMNEKGLVANQLYLANADYGKPEAGRRKLSVAAWAQYALDNFATVAEAVEALRAEPFQIVQPAQPNKPPSPMHLSLSDATGDSAIFEYIGGKLVIHHGRQYQLMTNEPPFDQQLALTSYWQGIGGDRFLPGTIEPADRFVRTSFFLSAISKKADPSYLTAVPDGSYANQAVAAVASVMRAVSVPLGMHTPGEPNAASTLWRTVADQTNRVYMFDSATSPNTFWVPLAKLDFSEGAKVKKLTLTGGKVYAGDASSKFEPAEPFAFLPFSPE
jgi:penicillin V acylase-like amidase (Ntn superfamily)